jgi:hypothetical protein
MNWTINQMDCVPQEDGQTDVVVTAHWQCVGTEVSGGDTYTSRAYGTAGFTYTPGTPFTPYDQLTQDQVLTWCWASGVDKTGVETTVQNEITDQITPPVVTPPLPWEAPAA